MLFVKRSTPSQEPLLSVLSGRQQIPLTMRKEGKLSGWTPVRYGLQFIPRSYFFVPERNEEGCVVGRVGRDGLYINLKGQPSKKSRESYGCHLGRSCTCGCREYPSNKSMSRRRGWRNKTFARDESAEVQQGTADAAEGSWLGELRTDRFDDDSDGDDDCAGPASSSPPTATFAAFLPLALRLQASAAADVGGDEEETEEAGGYCVVVQLPPPEEDMGVLLSGDATDDSDTVSAADGADQEPADDWVIVVGSPSS